MKALIFILGVILTLSYAEDDIHPLSDEFIEIINQKAKTWKVRKGNY